MVSLNELSEEALVDILVKPKNAIIKQYAKLFELEDVVLKFTDGALSAIAKEAMKRKTGARGLRAILENVMLDLMYDVPSQDNVSEVVINEDAIIGGGKPIMVYSKQPEKIQPDKVQIDKVPLEKIQAKG